MRKANQQTTIAELQLPQDALVNASGYLDVNAKARLKHESQIRTDASNIRSMKEQISRYSADIKNRQARMKTLETELEKMPAIALSVETIRKQFEAIAKLQWVGKVVLNGESVMITTRPGVLKTTFHTRIVYKDGQRCEELLAHPLVLPLPTYDLQVSLGNLGGSWDRNANLLIRLADPQSHKFFPDPNQLGYIVAASAHWASGENSWTEGMATAQWGTLCLSEYKSILSSSGKTGLIDLLNEVVMFLQNAGWARAYRSKTTWMATLGFHPYYTQLMRPLLAGETFHTIQADTRTRLPQYLKENGLTQHMFDYGAPAEGEQMPDNDAVLTEEMIVRARQQLDAPLNAAAIYWSGNHIRPIAQTMTGIVQQEINDEVENNEEPIPF